jgi:predicted nucleotidyltransferase component of viral defense system
MLENPGFAEKYLSASDVLFMKKVDEVYQNKITDLIVARDLNISEYALEKDFIVTEVLLAISAIKNDTFNLVFCGGTCLSKAYGIIKRISEDVDIKVEPKCNRKMTNSQTRKAMRELKDQIVAALEGIGFDKNDITQSAQDENSYVVFNAAYASYFEHDSAMRSNLKLELNITPLLLPAVEYEIGFLFNELAQIPEPKKTKMQCIDLLEALAEKLISFPKRLAKHLRDPDRYDFDKALVRHLFDVHRIIDNCPGLIRQNELRFLIKKSIEKDALDFANQHPEFLTNPVGEIANAIHVAETDHAYRDMYQQFINVMVYEDSLPTFDEVIASFSNLLFHSLPGQS